MGDSSEGGLKEWIQKEEMKQERLEVQVKRRRESVAEPRRLLEKKRVKQNTEVSEWEKENLIVFLAMEQH